MLILVYIMYIQCPYNIIVSGCLQTDFSMLIVMLMGGWGWGVMLRSIYMFDYGSAVLYAITVYGGCFERG